MSGQKDVLAKPCFLILIAGMLGLAQVPAHAESFVQATVESRVMLAFRADPESVQRFIPSPWRLNPVPKGPMARANLFVVFGDREIDLGPDGKPKGPGVTRFTAFAAPARNPTTEKSGVFVIRIFTSDEKAIPGAYKSNVAASVSRQYSFSGEGVDPGIAEETWRVNAANLAEVHLAIRYHRTVPSRGDRELHVYSAVDPAFYRIYRVDQGTDIVMSKPMSIDRLMSYDARIEVPEFKDIFDGTEELISVAAIPLYNRRVFLP